MRRDSSNRKLVERFVLQLRNIPCSVGKPGRNVHRGSVHQLCQQFQRDIESLLRIRQREEHGIIGAFAVDHAAQRIRSIPQASRGVAPLEL